MTNLPKGTFENIEFGKIKNSLKDNKGTTGVKDYVRNYIGGILDESGINKIEVEDFELMEGYIENLLEYQKIFSYIFPNKNLNLFSLEKLVSGQSIEEFKNFCNNENVKEFLESSKEKNLEYAIKLYDIKTPAEFESLCNN
ncbi:MAG: hypothetical protein NWP80_00035, partial [Candidatus Gracilibacteria bacterium]|nr:hypothetical protein [Candidatus Gracilibacteria bacterium]